MNPQWNTPPNGDFAAYVERLTAQVPLTAAQRDENAHMAIDNPAETPNMLTHVPGQPAAAYQPMQNLPRLAQRTAPDNLLARGILAALGGLREKLERNLQNSQKTR